MQREESGAKGEVAALERRNVLRTGAVVLAGATLAGTILRSGPARAQGKASQASVMYQTTPHAGQQCDGCVHFIPGKSATAMGACQVVEGAISPHGWCVLFAPKA